MDLSRFKYDETSPSCLTRDGLPVGWLSKNGYWVIKLNKKTKTTVHRVIWQLLNGPVQDGLVVDHIDRNKLNNRISNLRLATYSQNGTNRSKRKNTASGMIGVYIDNRGKFIPYLVINGKRKSLGAYKSKYDAALRRDMAAWRVYGEYGNYNYPDFVKAYLGK